MKNSVGIDENESICGWNPYGDTNVEWENQYCTPMPYESSKRKIVNQTLVSDYELKNQNAYQGYGVTNMGEEGVKEWVYDKWEEVWDETMTNTLAIYKKNGACYDCYLIDQDSGFAEKDSLGRMRNAKWIDYTDDGQMVLMGDGFCELQIEYYNDLLGKRRYFDNKHEKYEKLKTKYHRKNRGWQLSHKHPEFEFCTRFEYIVSGHENLETFIGNNRKCLDEKYTKLLIRIPEQKERTHRVVKGGKRESSSLYHRMRMPQDSAAINVGFRVVLPVINTKPTKRIKW